MRPEKGVGLKACGCGVYVESHYKTCPSCSGSFEDRTETCPTCSNKIRPGDEACETCIALQYLSPSPRSVDAA